MTMLVQVVQDMLLVLNLDKVLLFMVKTQILKSIQMDLILMIKEVMMHTKTDPKHLIKWLLVSEAKDQLIWKKEIVKLR